MKDYRQIVKEKWGYISFRPMQEEIIKSVLEGKDTLGLMPTGGGKSLTFQVPALAMDGLCLVITPLIALMKDQVENLKKKQIKALAVHSGLTREEIDIALNNCIFGDFKFLYLSPERLASEIFRVRVQEMKVNLITVDEAHCISHWGYDFRPSYLKIAELRKLLPDVPVLALTATATTMVIDDIQDKLLFREKRVIRSSFVRENLIYAVKKSENREKDVLDLSKKMNGSGIVYVRSRKKCVDVSKALSEHGVSSSFYHAGLPYEQRSDRQMGWTIGKIRIMVATNAFGMGIDKPDVRFVIHADLPDSPESYFQEAGRAGRDGNRAFAILLSSPDDHHIAEQRYRANFPDLETIKNVYSALGNFLNIPVGGGKGMAYDFSVSDFVSAFKIELHTAFSSLKILEREGYIEITEEINSPSRLKFVLGRDDLYKFQIANAFFDAFIKLILRSYSGVFSEYTVIDETSLARKASVDRDVVVTYLNRLSTMGIIKYIKQKRTPMVIYLEERLDEKSLHISKENYRIRKERYWERAKAMLNYASTNDTCRSQLLLKYFGETHIPPCNYCDVCRNKKERDLQQQEFDMISDEVKGVVALEPLRPEDLLSRLVFNREKVLQVVQWMLDNDYLAYTEDQKLTLKSKR
ncbi:MAG: RecQ family ATP-dependent DNA helicase [Bacteroidales bacterium]|nr:RecQ family ATP-dependent DNA helicase [Bacteroidales bacterium]MBN2764340.1 RecQ family ATP-dependent DNA helicase [Bacteroidales bacterium]